jgi:WD40 repeat protein
LLGLLLSFPIATKTVAETKHISDKEKNEISTNHEERQIIKLIDEKTVYKLITAVAWSPDGKSIATAGGTTEVTIWDSTSLLVKHQLDQGSRGHGKDHITFSPDSRYLASGLSTVNVWNVADGTLRTKLFAPHVTPDRPQAIDIEGLRFGPDGSMLVVAYAGDKKIVIAYHTADGKIAWTYEPQRTIGLPLLTTPLVFTPDGKRVILGTGEHGGPDVNLRRLSRVLILDAESGKSLRSIDNIHMDHPTALALSQDGKLVATGTETGAMTQTTNLKTHQLVTFDNQDPVRIWNTETGELVRELPVHTRVWSLAFSRDGKYLFGAKSDFETHLTLAVWDVKSGKMVQEVKNNPGPMSLAVSPDGKRLAAACQNKLSVYDIATSR